MIEFGVGDIPRLKVGQELTIEAALRSERSNLQSSAARKAKAAGFVVRTRRVESGVVVRRVS